MLGWLFGKRKEKTTLSKEEFTQRQYETEMQVMEYEKNPPAPSVMNPTTTNPYITVQEEKEEIRKRIESATEQARKGEEISLKTIFSRLDAGYAVSISYHVLPQLCMKEDGEYCVHTFFDNTLIKGEEAKKYIEDMVHQFYEDKIPYYAMPDEFQRGDYCRNFSSHIHTPTAENLMHYLKLRPSTSVMLGGARLNIRDNKYYVSEKQGNVFVKREVKIVEFTQYLELFSNGYDKPQYFYNGKQIRL